jgi:hypothetical protein
MGDASPIFPVESRVVSASTAVLHGVDLRSLSDLGHRLDWGREETLSADIETAPTP